MAAQIRDKFYQWPKVTANQIWPPKYGQFLINIKRREPMVATLSSNGSHTRPRGNLVYHITVNRDTHAAWVTSDTNVAFQGAIPQRIRTQDSMHGLYLKACTLTTQP